VVLWILWGCGLLWGTVGYCWVLLVLGDTGWYCRVMRGTLGYITTNYRNPVPCSTAGYGGVLGGAARYPRILWGTAEYCRVLGVTVEYGGYWNIMQGTKMYCGVL